MKKLLLLAAGAFVSMNALATTWAVVGSYTEPNWNFEASTKLEGTGDVLSCTIQKLTPDFKIVDIDDANWSVQYGTATPIELGKDYVLDAKNGGPDPSNISFSNNILYVNNAVVNWTPSTATLSITGNAVTGMPTLYVTGSFCDWKDPGDGNSVLCTEENGIYTAVVNLGDSGNVEFKVAGPGWSNEIAGPQANTLIGHEPVAVSKGGSNLKTTLKGEQTLKLNYNEMTMWFEGEGEVPGIETIWAVVGAYTTPDWNFDASTKFTENNGVYSCTIPNLTTDFKIVDITNNNWDIAYGLSNSEGLSINQPTVLSREGGNINFSGLIQAVKNAKLTWDPSNATLTVSAAQSDLVIEYPTLYMTGSFCEWAAPGEEGTIKGSLSENVQGLYTFDVDFGKATDIKFKLAGAGWSNEIAGGVEVGTAQVKVTKGGDDLWTSLTGKQSLVFLYDEMLMYFYDGTSAVDSIVKENSEEVIYNLQGVRIDRNQMAKGIYIINGKKVMVK